MSASPGLRGARLGGVHRAELNVPGAVRITNPSGFFAWTASNALSELDSLQIAATNDQALALLQKGLQFRGHPLIDSQGRKLGKIVAVRLDERGNVVEYVARRGLLGWVTPRNKLDPKQLGTSGGEMAVMHEIEEPHPPLSLPEGNTTSHTATDE